MRRPSIVVPEPLDFIRLFLGPVVAEPWNFIRLSLGLAVPEPLDFIRLFLGPVVAEPLDFIGLFLGPVGAELLDFIRLFLWPVVAEPLDFIRLFLGHPGYSFNPKPTSQLNQEAPAIDPCPQHNSDAVKSGDRVQTQLKITPGVKAGSAMNGRKLSSAKIWCYSCRN